MTPAPQRKLVPIGQFARQSSLTPRQLRYYHALGLLLPAAVDPASGYRYYAETQRATAELIALLRSVDMPLPEIQSLLADRSPANVRAVFDRLRTTVEERLQRAGEILDRLETLTLEETVMEQQATYPFEAFSDESREVLLLAQRLADDAKDATIGTEHMLAALASGSAGAAGTALRGLGIETARVMDVAGRVHDERGDRAPATGRALPDPALRDVVAQAFAAAGVNPAEPREGAIDTANLLRAVLGAPGDEGAGAVLRRLGVTPSQVEARLS